MSNGEKSPGKLPGETLRKSLPCLAFGYKSENILQAGQFIQPESRATLVSQVKFLRDVVA